MTVRVIANVCLRQLCIVGTGRREPGAAAKQDPSDYTQHPSDNLVAVDQYRLRRSSLQLHKPRFLKNIMDSDGEARPYKFDIAFLTH